MGQPPNQALHLTGPHDWFRTACSFLLRPRR